MQPYSLQLISNNNVYISEPFEKKNSYYCNKNIDEQLVEKDCSITSDDEKGFYTSSEECDTESPAVNKNDDILW